MPARAPMPEGAPTAAIRSLEDIVALCEARSELRVNLEHNVHLVHLEPGRIEIRPNARAPRTLANDLQQKLRNLTGERWTVSIASQGGAPTLAEQKQAAKTARFEAVAQGTHGARRAGPVPRRGNRGGARHRHSRCGSAHAGFRP